MKSILLAAAAFLVACAPNPSIDRSPDAQLTYDGLAPVVNSRFAEAWADPEIDLSSYNKVLPGEVEFEFRTHTKAVASAGRGAGELEFQISYENKKRLIEEVSNIFSEELRSARGWEMAEEPGENTLILTGRFLDIVSHVPRSNVGTGEVMISSVGAITLVIEASDSLSGETLFRAVQRSTVRDRQGSIYVSPNNVASWTQVRRWASDWATALREGLESLHE